MTLTTILPPEESLKILLSFSLDMISACPEHICEPARRACGVYMNYLPFRLVGRSAEGSRSFVEGAGDWHCALLTLGQRLPDRQHCNSGRPEPG